MADLVRFREKVTICRKRKRTADGRQYTLEDLGMSIGLSADELGRRLRGNGKQPLSQDHIFAIVRALAEWETLTWDEAGELLAWMEYPLASSGWQTDLQRVLGPLPRSVQQIIASRVTSPGTEPSIPVRRRLFQARDLPKEYVPRPEAFNQIKRLLLTQKTNQTAAITTALRGAGGFGKTTLASALCHDLEIQEAFPDGILWIELGEHPPGPLTVLNELLHALEPSEREAITLEEARERWKQALANRACLLVIDDVWQTEALKELLQGGARCRRLVTTRNDQILPDDAKRIWVDAMEPAEAMTLLCQGVIEAWQQTLDQSVLEQVVVQHLGCWPMLVSLARGMLKNQLRLKKTPQQALAQIKHAYEERGTATFHLGDREERQRNVDACLDVNLRQLEEWVPAHYQARQHYQELAIFPEDIPVTTLQIYWQATGGLNDWEVEDLCLHLSDLSLVLSWDPEHATIRVHDVLRSYLIQRAGNQLSTLHQRLLDACYQHYHLTQWADLPQSETYLWHRLVYHLCHADNQETFQTTLTDLLYMTRKVRYLGVSALEADLMLATTSSPNENMGQASLQVTSLRQTIMRISHCLRKVQTEAEIGGLLLNYLNGNESLTTQLLALESKLTHPFLTAWHPMPRASSALLRTLQGHTSGVSGCAFSPDGMRIVSASWDDTLKVWDSATGAELLTFRGHASGVNACAFSPDGKWIVSASWDTLKIWEAATGAELLTLSGNTGSVGACAFSPDGRWIVSTSLDDTLKVWEVATGAELLTFRGHASSVGACAFSPDGTRIVSASWDTLKIWEAATGAELFTLSGNTGSVGAFSPDGRWIVSTSFDLLKVWDSTTGAQHLTLRGHAGSVRACGFSPDGTRIVSASVDHTLKVWDSATGAEQLTLSGHAGPVLDCAFSPDGTRIVSASWDKMLKVWDSATGAQHLTLSVHTVWTNACEFSPDGKWIVFALDRTLKVWDSATGAEHLTLSGHTNRVSACWYSPDGKFLVSASEDYTLKVWDSTTGAEHLTLSGHTGSVTACRYSPDGKFLVSASLDGTLKVWDSTTGAQVRTLRGHVGSVSACAFSPDGTRVVSASERTLKVWNSTTGAEHLTLSGYTDWVIACGFSPDGMRIISASQDNTLKVWDSTTGVGHLTLSGHTDRVSACRYSPDGKFLVSASLDCTLKLWEVQTGQCMLTFPVEGALYDCAFHPDGEHLVACGAQGVYLLRLVL